MMKTVIVAGIEPVKKGSIRVKIDGVEFGSAINQTRDHLLATALSAPLEQIETNLNTYVHTCISAEMQIPDLLPNTSRIRAPMNFSEVGGEFTGNAFLPVASYAMVTHPMCVCVLIKWFQVETPPSNAEYFRNSYEMVMARRNMRPSDYHDFDEFEKARTMGLIISYAVQTFDYIGDAVELGNRRLDRVFTRKHVGNEEFGHIWATLTGDCEDSGCGIFSTLKAFLNTEFDPRVGKHPPSLRFLKPKNR